MTAIEDMDAKRLNAELVIAEGQLRSHRPGVHGSCRQRCEDPHPCKVARSAAQTIGEVSQALAERSDLIEQARADWL